MRFMAGACSVVVVLVLSWTAATAQVAAGDGTSRESPIPFGEAGSVGDYELKVGDVLADASSFVTEPSDPFDADSAFFMVRLEATYTGTESGHAWSGLQYSVVGDNNLGYSTRDFGCGDFSDQARDTPELFTGGSVVFNVCWSVPADQTESLVMYAEPNLLFNEERVWFSLDKATMATPSA